MYYSYAWNFNFQLVGTVPVTPTTSKFPSQWLGLLNLSSFSGPHGLAPDPQLKKINIYYICIYGMLPLLPLAKYSHCVFWQKEGVFLSSSFFVLFLAIFFYPLSKLHLYCCYKHSQIKFVRTVLWLYCASGKSAMYLHI